MSETTRLRRASEYASANGTCAEAERDAKKRGETGSASRASRATGRGARGAGARAIEPVSTTGFARPSSMNESADAQ